MKTERPDLYVVAQIHSPRLVYVLDFIFNEFLGLSYQLVKQAPESEIPVISYGSNTTFSIYNCGLLEETMVRDIQPEVSEVDGLTVIFKGDDNFSIPFDLFSAVFYFISRYEEYLPHQKDLHGRFRAEDSFAYKNNLHKIPLVDKWIMHLAEKLKSAFPELRFKKREFTFVPTFDIDQFFSVKAKGMKRILGATARDFMQLKLKSIRKRIGVLSGLAEDEFDTFSYIRESLLKFGWHPVYFIHCGEYSTYDKQVNLLSPEMRRIIKEHMKAGQTGIHPSYVASSNKNVLISEKEKLEKLIGTEISMSRFHYLKLDLPHSYRMLTESGIINDHTMGWASVPGFRAGTATPFYFYDLLEEKALPLKIYPFSFMEVSLFGYLNLSPEEALNEIEGLINEVKSVNGIFISLWHNENLKEADTGIRRVWENMLAKVKAES